MHVYINTSHPFIRNIETNNRLVSRNLSIIVNNVPYIKMASYFINARFMLSLIFGMYSIKMIYNTLLEQPSLESNN